jgi:hypothetical protein
MNKEKSPAKRATKPVRGGSGPHSIEEILKHIDPTPDRETERFVSAIYADRRESAKRPRAE